MSDSDVVVGRLAEAAGKGRVLDLLPLGRPAGTNGRLFGTDPRAGLFRLPATYLRDLLLGHSGGPVDPRGVRLRGARITGQLDLTDVHSNVPLSLVDCHFDQPLLLDRAHLATVSLARSTVPGLYAERLHLDHALDLTGLAATGRSEEGAVRLSGARISGGLVLNEAVLANPGGPALAADGLHVQGHAQLEGVRASGWGERGAVRLLGAQVTGQLLMRKAVLANRGGPALVAEGVQVGQFAVLAGVQAAGGGGRGAVQLSGARISGGLVLNEAVLTNEDGPALAAQSVQVGQFAVLVGLQAAGGGGGSAVQLSGARISGGLVLNEAVLTNEDGPALTADRLRVEGHAQLEGVRVSGQGERGAVRLPGAQVTGQLLMRKAVLANPGGPALTADGLQVGQAAVLSDMQATACHGEGALLVRNAVFQGGLRVQGAVSNEHSGRILLHLGASRVEGPLALWDEKFWTTMRDQPDGDRPRLVLEGFTYRDQPEGTTPATWLSVLQQCMPRYASQPYRQLAQVCQAAGNEKNATAVLIAQQRALRAGGILAPGARWWRRISGATVGYGYRPGRALVCLLAVVALSCLLMAGAASFGLLVHPPTRGGSPCGWAEAIGSAAERTVPLVGFGVAGPCELTTAPATPWIFLTILVLRALGWALLTLFIAGVTGIIRKPAP